MAYVCPLNDHSGSKRAGLPSDPRGQSMLIVAKIVASMISKLFSAKLRPMHILQGFRV
jgi:hypothetical protein